MKASKGALPCQRGIRSIIRIGRGAKLNNNLWRQSGFAANGKSQNALHFTAASFFPGSG
jgi:hypothetical protein